MGLSQSYIHMLEALKKFISKLIKSGHTGFSPFGCYSIQESQPCQGLHDKYFLLFLFDFWSFKGLIEFPYFNFLLVLYYIKMSNLLHTDNENAMESQQNLCGIIVEQENKSSIKIVQLNLSDFKQKYRQGFFHSMKMAVISNQKKADVGGMPSRSFPLRRD